MTRRSIKRIICRAGILPGVLAAFFDAGNAERLPIKTYTTADGLPHNSINRIVRDSRGFLWFCTGDGLSRFDGYTFINYGVSEGLPHPKVNDLLETRTGEYWLATNNGLCRFNPKGAPSSHPVYAVNSSDEQRRKSMFIVYTPAEDTRLNRVINTLAETRDGNIWFGTRLGFFRVDRAGDRVELRAVNIRDPKSGEPQAINSILEDRYGAMWAGTPSGLYRCWPDGSVERYGKGTPLPDDNIHSLVEDRRGNLWVGTRNGGLIRLAFGAKHDFPIITRTFNRESGLRSDWIFDIYESSSGSVWIGTPWELLEFQANDEQHLRPIRLDTKTNGFSFHEIETLAEDLDGNLWLGGINGAMKIARNGFRTMNERDGVSSINDVFVSHSGDLYAYGYVLGDRQATVFDGGKYDLLNPDSVTYWFSFGRYDGNRFSWLVPSGWRGNGWTDKPYVLQSATGEWWIGQNAGLYLFPRVQSFAGFKTASPLAVLTTRNGLSSRFVYTIFEDRRGDIWISTVGPNGLARWERATRKVRDLTRAEGLPSFNDNLVTSFAEDSAGNVWVGFQPGGLARYAADRFTFFTIEDGLPSGRINDLHLDSVGRLWVATSSGGISRIDQPSANRPAFVNYTTDQGLSSNVTTAITDDLYGRVYVGTGRGVDQILAATGQIKHFTTADGLATGEILAAVRDRSGKLWFASRQGLSHFLPERERPSEPPPVLINGLFVAGARQPVSAVGERDISLPDISSGENQLQIDFLGLSFVPGDLLRYQYWLEGADTGWSRPTEQRSITYAKLSPGHYRFLVRAVNSAGVSSTYPASVTFGVLSPFWQRWWFVAIAVGLAGAIAYAFYRYRVSQLVALERVRTRIAADLHDDIGSSLSQISILSEVLRNQVGPQEAPVSRNLSLINRVSHEALDSMSDIVWAINPQQDHLSDLVRRMRRLASEALPARDIEFTFSAPGVGLDLKLGADIRREILLMFKETINNLTRHSKCTRTSIDLKIDGQWLELSVTDNGEGFDTAQETEGNGLSSLHRRSRSLGGETVVTSRQGEGTSVSIRVPHSQHARSRGGDGNR